MDDVGSGRNSVVLKANINMRWVRQAVLEWVTASSHPRQVKLLSMNGALLELVSRSESLTLECRRKAHEVLFQRRGIQV